MIGIYILLPHNTRTGGPEALLQLADALGRRLPSLPTHVVCYTPAEIADLRSRAQRNEDTHSELVFGEHEIGIPEYADYRVELAQRIPHSPQAVVVVPEVLADLIPALSRNTILLWWLSVDNAFGPLSRVNLNHLRRPNVWHACQSHYAERFVTACGLQSLGPLSDYTTERFAAADAGERAGKRTVAINASAKVISDLDAIEAAIATRDPGLSLARVAGLSREALIELLSSAAVFVDLASFPGKDRMPREAARLGCPVVLADAGAGHYGEDFPVPASSRVSPWAPESIADAVFALLDPSRAEQQLAAWRGVLERERDDFDTEACNIFEALVANIPPPALTDEPPHSALQLFDRRQDAYALWRGRRTLQEIDGQLLAERMLSKWRFRPRFAIGVQFTAGNGGWLADTIDSLGRQWCREWRLAIFAPGIEAPPELAGVEQICWLGGDAVTPSLAALHAAWDADFYAMLPAGTTLEDHALQVIADEINASPQWLAVYTDHDEVGSGGARAHFKPEFNPELLYSTNYVGPTGFVCREALQAFADGAELASASPYGLLLQIYAQTGSETIGHIADPLVHLPAMAPDSEADRRALERHLAQRGLAAVVEDGWFEHTRRVRFRPPTELTISVIVMAHSQPGYLKCCLESLLRCAGMPVTEAILIAHRVEDPDLRELISQLAGGALGLPCRVQEERGEFAPAEFRNRAAQRAKGDYLLFVDDDVEFFQDHWLSALAGHAHACGLAAVGPRLVSGDDGPPRIVDGGRVLGLFGLAGSLADGQPGMLDGRHDLRLQLDQQISALPGNCLLVDRREFERLGGFDQEAAPLVLHDLDFCIRLGKTGRRAAWLASVDVVHHGGVTARECSQSAAQRAVWNVANEREKDTLLALHLQALANDGSYNRHLSLRRPFDIDTELVADWNPRFHDRPRLMGVPLTTGAGQYRVVAPLKALARAGLAQSTIVHPINDNELRALMPVEVARLAPDTLIVQNCIEDNMIVQLAASARLNGGVRHVATIDDRLGDLPRDNPIHAVHARHARTQLRKGLSHCSRLIVTTEPLRDYCADLIDDIRVVPNRLERDQWAGLPVAENPGRRPRVGWVGAMQHGGDLKLLEPVVRELADEIDWVFMGMCPEALRPHVREVHEFVSIRDYPAKMASLALDLALAPLEVHPFNECKSNLRLLEYGALGWPVICTDIAPYRTASPPVTRLPNHHQAWTAAISERVHARDALKAEGLLLKKWVYDNFILEDGLNDWLEALAGD